jgi:hypothetical protein
MRQYALANLCQLATDDESPECREPWTAARSEHNEHVNSGPPGLVPPIGSDAERSTLSVFPVAFIYRSQLCAYEWRHPQIAPVHFLFALLAEPLLRSQLAWRGLSLEDASATAMRLIEQAEDLRLPLPFREDAWLILAKSASCGLPTWQDVFPLLLDDPVVRRILRPVGSLHRFRFTQLHKGGDPGLTMPASWLPEMG